MNDFFINYFASVASGLTLAGLGSFVYFKFFKNKQENKNSIVVNGQAHFEGSFNVSNKVDEKIN